MKIEKNKYLIKPDSNNPELTKIVSGFDENSNKINTNVIVEKDLTIFLNNQEIACC